MNRDNFNTPTLGINTASLCYGCRSAQVEADGEKCPMCSAIDANRERTRDPLHFSWVLVLGVGMGLMWVVNLWRKNLGE